MMEIAKSLADGGKEVVGALEKRIDEASGTIDTRGTKLAETLHEKADQIDKTLGVRALEIADDARCAHQPLPGTAGRPRRDRRVADRSARPVGRQRDRLADGAAQPVDPHQCGRGRTLARSARRLDRRGDPCERARGRTHHHDGVGERHGTMKQDAGEIERLLTRRPQPRAARCGRIPRTSSAR